jgi:hypothetical protein
MISFLPALLLFLFAPVVLAQDIQEPISINSCRLAGFDPMQLSCSTCDILPESVVSKCRACCQSFWNVKAKTKRYEAAVLLHVDKENYYPEIDQVYNEDVETIQEKKGKNRFWTKTMSVADLFEATP